MAPAYVLLGVLVLLALTVAVSHHRFVRQRNLVAESWRQVHVELTRRHDLIPTLVETVQGYAAHESSVLGDVTKARQVAVDAKGVAAQGEAETFLRRSFGGLLAVAEAYPDLTAAEPFQQLQAQLAETEDRIVAGRRFYNANVRALNARVEAFPSSLVASAFHLEKAAYFTTLDPENRAPVEVDVTP